MRTTLTGLICLAALTACGAPGAPLQQPTPTTQSVPQATRTPQPGTTPTATALAANTPWVPPTALAGTPRPGAVATLTAAPQLRVANLSITNKAGESIQMTVEIADTDASRSLGLMHRAQMDPYAGMLFSWTQDNNGGFWMYNTILSLSIAFIAADGTIIYIADMQPLDETTVGPTGPYRHALETNQGFFRAHGIEVGDKVTLPGASSAVVPGGLLACPPPVEAQRALGR